MADAERIIRTTDPTAASRLLHDVFAKARFATPDYLKWYYAPPEGPGVTWQTEAEVRASSTLAALPQVYHRTGARVRLALIVNLAVAPTMRGKGAFMRLGRFMIEDSPVSLDAQGIVGVANANATHGWVDRSGFRLVMPLPVVVGVAMPGRPRGVTSHQATPEFLAGTTARALFDDLDFGPDDTWTQRWSPEKLAWRLANPAARYAVHAGESGLAVSIGDRVRGVPLAVILKFAPRRGVSRMATGPLIRAAAATHRTPAYLHGGVNRRAPVVGVPLPRRVLPSPLNLIYLKLGPEAPEPKAFAPSTFEFLDFDAY